MANKPFTLNDGVFQSKLRKMAKKAKIDEKDFIKEQSALFLRDLISITPPIEAGTFGLTRTTISKKTGKKSVRARPIGTKGDREQGEGALRIDLLYIFSPQKPDVISWAFSKFGRGKLRRGEKITGAGIALTSSEIRKWHRKNLDRRGRTRPLPTEDRLWVSEKLLDNYFKIEKKDVGTAKASLAKAMKAINPRQSVPKWISNNFSRTTGRGSLSVSSKGPTARSKSSAYGLDQVVGKLKSVEKWRSEAMEKRMLNLIKANARKAGLKVK